MCRSFFLIFSILFISSCNNQAQDKNLKHSNYSYDVGRDVNQVGYIKDENTGEVTSISCLYVNDKNLLVLDPVHDNIKLIDIRTGRLSKVSDKIAGRSVWLSDLVFYRGNYYVTSLNNIVYVLDNSLKKVEEILIDNPYGEKRFFFQGDNLLVCTYSSEFFQTKKMEGYISANRIEKGSTVRRDTVYMGKGYASFERKYEGYNVITKDDSTCVGNGVRLLCINNKIPKLPYSCKNVFLGKDILTFFEVDEKRLTVDIYEN